VEQLLDRAANPDAIMNDLSLTPDELAFVRGEYLRVGRRLVEHYHQQLPAAVARSAR
jgi:hypothetical protein